MSAPSSTIDIFAEAQLLDPYPHYAELRTMGSLVALDAVGYTAITRCGALSAARLADIFFSIGRQP